MERKIVSGVVLTLLLMGVLTLTFDTQSSEASGTFYEYIYIRADGSIDPPTAPISTVDNVTYTFTGNISTWGFIVERSNIIIDGSGYTLAGQPIEPIGTGFTLSGVNNVTIKNTNVKFFISGVRLESSSNITISNNTIGPNGGIWQGPGIHLEVSYDNTISGNNIVSNDFGITLDLSSSNFIYENNITCNYYGIWGWGSNNTIYHNNFNSAYQVLLVAGVNTWDDGYPSGGNYWCDYNGTDLYRGPYQNETGSDGIGDTPYVIDAVNQDRYPLMNPWPPINIAVMNVSPSKNIVTQGSTLGINVTAINLGITTETFNVTAYYDDIAIETKTVTNLPPSEETNLTFTWNTTGVAKGDYVISANATPVPGETNTADNTYVDGVVTVLSPGHDVAIKGVTPSTPVVGQECSLSINVTAKNYGIFVETFNVTVYANTTLIGTQTVNNLPNGTSTILTFTWNTTGYALGNYTISAVADTVPGETDTTDNTYTDGWVEVRLRGDVNGDGTVDILDIIKWLLINAGIITEPEWMVQLADMSCDGQINILDLIQLLLVASGIL